MVEAGTKRAQRGTHYTGETTTSGEEILRISTDCDCEDENCPFDGTERPLSEMTCPDCGTTLHPHAVQYSPGVPVAHNLTCPYHAMTYYCLD